MKRVIIRYLQLSFLLVLIFHYSYSQKNYSIGTELHKFRNLEEFQYLFVDTICALSFNNIITPEINSTFYHQNATEIKLDENWCYWVRISLKNLSNLNKFIIVTSIDWETAEMYIPKSDSSFEVVKAGMNSKRPEFGFEHYNYFELEIPNENSLDIYFKLKFYSRNPGDIEFNIISKDHYLNALNKHKHFYISCLAIFIAMILYNLLIFYITMQREYVFYVILLVGILGAFGIFFFYNIFPSYRGFLIAEQLFYTLAGVGIILFFSTHIKPKTYFRQIHQYFKKIHRFLKYSLYTLLASFVIHESTMLWSERYPFVTQYLWLFVMASILICIFLINVYAVVKKTRPAYYILIAFSIGIVGAVYTILTVAGIISFSNQHQAKQVLLLTQVIQVVLFSLAIGDKMLRLQEGQTRAVMASLKIQKEINVKLEQKVLERTAEIRRKNEVLEQQKEEITTQRDQIESQKQEVIKQRDEIARHQKDITDSIEYAKRIQTAALPSDDYIDNVIHDYFILFKPRDIVSGDFYWIKRINDYIIIIAADCTGHGVPGAFMSMLGISLLNEIIQKREITQANQALNELRKQIKQSLGQTEEHYGTRDGMDIAFCAYNTKTNILQFAGAFNPLFLIRDSELIVVKGDKMPVGIHFKKEESFTNHEIEIQPNDRIYIFSDGYYDQIGGERNKKFMTQRFMDLLLNIHEKPMKEQRKILNETLELWQDGYDQLDDILVFGMKFD